MSRALTRMFATLAAVGMLTLGGRATIRPRSGDGSAAALLVAAENAGRTDAAGHRATPPSSTSTSRATRRTAAWRRPTSSGAGQALDGTENGGRRDRLPDAVPGCAAAQAYLDEAEEVLSEMGTGITLQPDTPSVGDESRHYAGTISGSGLTAEAQNFLFREGPVVAKVYIVGFGTTLDDALPIAQAAADRTAAWLAARPQGSPGASPSVHRTAASPQPSMALATHREPELRALAHRSRPRLLAQDCANGRLSARASSQYTFRRVVRESRRRARRTWSRISRRRAARGPRTTRMGRWSGWNSPTPRQSCRRRSRIIETTATVRWCWSRRSTAAATPGWSCGPAMTHPPARRHRDIQPAIAAGQFATDRLRISLGDIVAGWSEIDAVELVGTVP